MSDFEKAKRKEKPKGAYRQSKFYVLAAICLVLLLLGVMAILLMLPMPLCACSPVEETASAIVHTNDAIAAWLTEPKVAAMTNAPTVTAAAIETAAAMGSLNVYGDCYYNWNTQPDEAATVQIQAALDATGIEGLTGQVTAYGEDYICGEGASQTRRFVVMDRSVSLTVSMANLNDYALLGEMIEKVLRAIEPVKIDQPRDIVMVFSANALDTLRWRMSYVDAFAALKPTRMALRCSTWGIRNITELDETGCSAA